MKKEIIVKEFKVVEILEKSIKLQCEEDAYEVPKYKVPIGVKVGSILFVDEFGMYQIVC